ncbi:hypothetical protein K8089_00595 [Aequorivita sp. F47161]|uniref:Phage holin family protein n=1 Tax=Aequorivita vitellina TaxID=2874475 RepID=A0A9X1TZ05_9FLAO|nr:hypothetical protein [Aequorivita vitellina]MCG2417499.1 hypothetical protein [Aequorivita vitellina]
MAFSSLKESLNRVVDRVEEFSISTAEYYKLRLFKSTMKGAISLVNLLVYGSLSLFVMLFISIGAAFWLGTFFEHQYVGFLLIGAFYGIILIFMFIYGRKIIERNLLHKFSGLLYDEEDLDPKIAAENELNEYQETLQENKIKKENISNS